MDVTGLGHQDLLEIFKHLSAKDLVHCSQVCKAWYGTANDTLLWKQLLLKDFGIKEKRLIFKPADRHHKTEYIRLVDECPSTLLQTLDSHKDEVLHVGFSNDGQEMVSCSKVRKYFIEKALSSFHHVNFRICTLLSMQ